MHNMTLQKHSENKSIWKMHALINKADFSLETEMI